MSIKEAVAVNISGRNKFPGKVKDIKSGAVMAQVTIDVNGGELVSAITNDSVNNLGLKIGDDVTALVKATDVMIIK
ncbi:MAG: TOBE domain-containing protein [Bacillota bacterium]